MIIGMSSTRNWYQYLLTNIFAMLSNNKVEKMYLFIEDDYIEELDLLKKRFNTEFVCININNKVFDKYIDENCPNISVRYSKCTLSRLFFPKEIKEDKVLYIDVDAIAVADISGLWNIDLKDYYVCGTPDSGMARDGVVYLKFIDSNIPYINAGVLLMNLDLIRKNKIDDKWLEKINKERLMYHDQDAINSVCKDHIKIFSPEYNCSASTTLLENKDEIKIMHYTMKKTNWVRDHKYSELWYKYEELYNQFKKEMQNK